MVTSYTRWTSHGEELIDHDYNGDYQDLTSSTNEVDEVNEILNDLRDPTPLHDLQDEDANYDHVDRNWNPILEPDTFTRLMRDAERELYPGCRQFSKLSFLVKLLHLKTFNRWSNKSFNMLLELLKDAFPEGETLPTTYYEAKKVIRDLGLGYDKIHACKHDCALFWKENEFKDECPECKSPRYVYDDGRNKRVPQKVLRHFPLIPRLQRLFISKKTAVDMRWHKDKRVNDGVLRHPAVSESWKDFDLEHISFVMDGRNVRLGIASDGFNPFGNMSNSYSMWPVFVVPYDLPNLPQWKCMKDPFFMMSLLILGPTAPGNDIDVYLQPLINELKELWDVGVSTYNAASG